MYGIYNTKPSDTHAIRRNTRCRDLSKSVMDTY
jgi:hypothetical protein